MSFEMNHSGAFALVDFDLNGPRIGDLRLLKKDQLGFSPPSRQELTAIFSKISRDVDRLSAALTFIAEAMNKGDVGLAAVAASRLRLPNPEPLDADGLSKASPDDPKHPGYPANAPDGKGGQFMPKEGAASDPKEKAERLKRLADRKTFRSVARRVLSAKRILKMIGRYVEEEIVQDIPVVNDMVGLASLEDDVELLTNIAQDVAESDAAIAFVNKGPVELRELQMSPGSSQSFRSFGEFKKIELEKQFGPAGEGYDYHHIVEQGPNAARFTQEQLQSTENIIRVPRLLHEEVSSAYGTARPFENGVMTPRAYLRDRSFKEQYEFGLSQLRRIGIIH